MKKKFIESIRVADPCHESWEEMTGNDRIRFCSHCAKDVNNISNMTRREVRRLVRRSGGKLCVRYMEHPETKAPMFTPITRRRAPLMAAGVVGASLSLAGITFAQGGSAGIQLRRNTNTERKDGSGRQTHVSTVGLATIKGKINWSVAGDGNGALVSLLDKSGTAIRVAQANDQGEFMFDIEPGVYTINVVSKDGVARTSKPNLEVRDGENSVELELALETRTVTQGMVVMLPLQRRNPLALTQSNLELAQDKFAQGGDINEKDVDGETPLFSAVEDGDLEMVKFLLDRGAKVNVRNDNKETPLMMIEHNTSVEIVELLLQRGAKVNRVDSDGDTALIRAAANGAKPDVLKALINAGADVNVQNDEGMTALMEAADENDLENVRVLLEAGADVNLRDADGDNAWDFATEKDIEDLLVSYGVVLDPEDLDHEPADGSDDFEIQQQPSEPTSPEPQSNRWNDREPR